MRKIVRAATSLAALVGFALTATAEARPRLSGEEELARKLEGRVAGAPVRCLTHSQARDLTVIDGTALVYGSGRTIYVNRTSLPSELDSSDVLVTKLHTSQLCRREVVRLHERTSHMFSGFVLLEDFVPYTRVASASR